MRATDPEDEKFKRDLVLVARVLARLGDLLVNRADISDLLDHSPPPGRPFSWPTIPQRRMGYSDLEETAFVCAMWRAYEYGVQGLRNVGERPRFPSSTHRTAAAAISILSEAGRQGKLLDPESSAASSRCLRICELADARLILEGDEGILAGIWSSSHAGHLPQERLTVRQIALLAGLETHVVAADVQRSRSRPRFRDAEYDGISIDDARAWLVRKGLYLQPTKQWAGPRFTLRDSFQTVDDLLFGIIVRVRELATEEGEHVVDAVNAVARRFGCESYQNIAPDAFGASEFLTELAEILRLSAPLLALRIEEAREHERLASIQDRLRLLDNRSDEGEQISTPMQGAP